MRRSWTWMMVAISTIGAVVGAPLGAQVPAEERVPIDDPSVLEAMGFAPDAENVYLRIPSDERGIAPDRSLREAGEGEAILLDFGPGFKFTTHSAHEFQGRTSVFNYDSDGQRIWRTSIGEKFADLTFQVPDGAAIGFIDVWVTDIHATEDLDFFVLESCSSGALEPDETTTTLVDGGTSVTPGDTVVELDVGSVPANNLLCRYVLRARFGTENPVTGFTLELWKARVSWARQVSAPPATATFNDVPTSDPFFQFVEALAASGITSGCGGGNYCPGDPLTRGQMAVFLARGLGLSFP